VITADNLTKVYGKRTALDNVSFEVPEGEIFGFVGPNGAGQTTLLQLAVGLTAPSAGSITVFGAAPRRQPLRVLPRVGFVAQDQPLYRGFSVAEMLTVGRKLNVRWDDGLARTRLTQLGIPLAKKVGKLSGGQRAQVALALALAKRPDLLLLDEPVASLDPLARRSFGLHAERAARWRHRRPQYAPEAVDVLPALGGVGVLHGERIEADKGFVDEPGMTHDQTALR